MAQVLSPLNVMWAIWISGRMSLKAVFAPTEPLDTSAWPAEMFDEMFREASTIQKNPMDNHFVNGFASNFANVSPPRPGLTEGDTPTNKNSPIEKGFPFQTCGKQVWRV